MPGPAKRPSRGVAKKPANKPLRARQPGAVRTVAKKAPAKRPQGGGIDLPKFVGEVGANLDALIPSRRASSTVKTAMKGNSKLSAKGNPVADFLSGFVKVKKTK